MDKQSKWRQEEGLRYVGWLLRLFWIVIAFLVGGVVGCYFAILTCSALAIFAVVTTCFFRRIPAIVNGVNFVFLVLFAVIVLIGFIVGGVTVAKEELTRQKQLNPFNAS